MARIAEERDILVIGSRSILGSYEEGSVYFHRPGGPGRQHVPGRQQDVRDGESSEAVLGFDRPGCHFLDDRGDLGFPRPAAKVSATVQ